MRRTRLPCRVLSHLGWLLSAVWLLFYLVYSGQDQQQVKVTVQHASQPAQQASPTDATRPLPTPIVSIKYTPVQAATKVRRPDIHQPADAGPEVAHPVNHQGPGADNDDASWLQDYASTVRTELLQELHHDSAIDHIATADGVFEQGPDAEAVCRSNHSSVNHHSGTPVNDTIDWLQQTQAALREPTPGDCAAYADGRDGLPIDVRECLEEYSVLRHFLTLTCCVKYHNRHAPTLNANRFNRSAPADIVILMIVHRRDEYLHHALASLAQVAGIDRALLVVSHDGYYPRVAQLVTAVTFCRVKQVYHPFSASLVASAHKLYPSTDDNVVTVDVETTNGQVSGAGTAVMYLHYDMATARDSFMRDVRLRQTAPKHHYWWAWNYVFRHGADVDLLLPPLMQTDQTLHVLTLEEDHVVTPDVLQLLRLWIRERPRVCPDCLTYNLGFHEEQHSVDPSSVTLESLATAQRGPIMNIGLVLDRRAFAALSYRTRFCYYNDYNWDWTVTFMQQRRDMAETSMTARLSRVRHIGLCGMHIKSSQCDSQTIVKQWQGTVAQPIQAALLAVQSQYPTTLHLLDDWHSVPFTSRPLINVNTGWLLGRSCYRLGSGTYRVWSTHINVEHCTRLSQSDIGWLPADATAMTRNRT